MEFKQDRDHWSKSSCTLRDKNLPIGVSSKELFWGEELPAASIAFHTAKALIPQSGDSPLFLLVEHWSFIYIKTLLLPCNGNASYSSSTWLSFLISQQKVHHVAPGCILF